MMARPDPLAERPRRGVLGRYLLDGERVLTAVHQHWAKVALPVASVVAGLVLVLVLDSYLPATLGVLANLLWWAWFLLIGWGLWKILEWRHDWFVATDKRLILTYGLLTQKVAMMPLAKVTDMSYNRSPLGRLLGYGTFVMESAGQDQALHRVEWVPSPDQTYRAICAEIFGVDDDERAAGQPGSDGPNAGPHGSDTTDYSTHSTAIRIRPAGSQPDVGGPDVGGPDVGGPDIRDADTGPIHYGPTNN